jgi:hypothetical protein
MQVPLMTARPTVWSLLGVALLTALTACAPSLEAPPRGPCGRAGERCCRPGEDSGVTGCGAGLACTSDALDTATCAACPAGQVLCNNRCAAACPDAATDAPEDIVVVPPQDAPPDVAMDAPEAATCPTASLTFCPSAGCVNVQQNSEHCGACDRACNAGEVCRMGMCQCAITGQTFCAGVGCTNLMTDTLNCGTCGMTCGGGQTCALGACACAITGQSFCLGAGCVNLTNDPANCGTCGAPCVEGQVCAGGACRCPAGLSACGESCVDFATSNTHCGGCNNSCASASPNAISVCFTGRCVQVACAPGYGDCSAAAGCEANLATDAINCGACSNRCRFPNAAARCIDGACALGACVVGFADCNGVAADGCETNLAADPTHCGACPTRCTAPAGRSATCVAGVCTVGVTCAAPLADCNGTMGDGCEENTNTSTLHCGGCGRACNATNGSPACVGGVCASIACTAGYGNCDSNLGNGCEVDFATSVTHCGRCANPCTFANASATCELGACRPGTCAAGFGNCDGNANNGCEVALATSATHCGICGRACVGGASCVAGACACPAGQTLCGTGASAICVNLLTNAAHCGACGRPCVAGQTCTLGVCRTTTDGGVDAAIDVATDTPIDRADVTADLADVPRDTLDADVADVPRDADAADVPRDADVFDAGDVPRDILDGG